MCRVFAGGWWKEGKGSTRRIAYLKEDDRDNGDCQNISRNDVLGTRVLRNGGITGINCPIRLDSGRDTLGSGAVGE
jgi:hypothetical protein